MSKKYIAIACVVVLSGIVIFFFSKNPFRQSLEIQPVATSSVPISAQQKLYKRDVPEGMREYRSIDYRFSLLYPQGLSIHERSEGGGATTITFEDIKKGTGFQIFVVPYDEPQVSEERFTQDEPSGVRESLEPVVINGATGAAFYSVNTALGETREVWFVYGGFLYEVTTLKPLEAWLVPIIQTWEFI